MARAFIGIGSNIGDRLAHLGVAKNELGRLEHTHLLGFSRAYESDADSPVPQGDFLNAAAALETGLDPHELLAELQQIERDAGRKPLAQRVKWGPRTLDLDLLLYGDQVICTDDLIVPHPMLHDRWYVLRPLADLDADFVHPLLQMTIGAILRHVEKLKPPPAGHPHP